MHIYAEVYITHVHAYVEQTGWCDRYPKLVVQFNTHIL